MNKIAHPLPVWIWAAGLLIASSLAHASVVVVVGAKSPVGPLNKTQVSDLYFARQSAAFLLAVQPSVIETSGTAKRISLKKCWAKQATSSVHLGSIDLHGRGNSARNLSSEEMKKLLSSLNPNIIGVIDKAIQFRQPGPGLCWNLKRCARR